MTTNQILVVDDNEDMARGLAVLFRELPAEVEIAYSAEQACSILEKTPFDLVVSDIRMPGVDGLGLLDIIVKRWPRTKVIMLTAHSSVESAVDAMKRGAIDYATKPFNNDELMMIAQRALREKGLEENLARAQDELGDRDSFEGIVGRDPRMLDIFDTIRRIADWDATVLVYGEHGTGKELVARAVHNRSGRSGPFVAFNAAAIPESLIEAELFGYRRGAFTGADRDHKGHFVEANKGTLMIDEVGNMPLALQVKLLRSLQEREVLPVGSSTPVKTDARIVASTNADLLAEARDGKFRQDFYYRLSVVQIELPPLRQRINDVPLLASHFIATRSAERETEPKEISSRAMRILLLHDWPGNVRELQNVMDRSMLFSTGETIEPEHIIFDDSNGETGNEPAVNYEEAKKQVLERFQRQFVDQLLVETHGNIAEAARRAGLTRSALYRLLKRLGAEATE